MFDLIIRGGLVVDGSGKAGRETDVGVRAGKITELGDLSRSESAESVDAVGKVVSPGFIDVHSHSDTYLLIDPSAQSKISQGVTTEVVGNCGASAAPLKGEYRLPSDWSDKSYPAEWSTVGEYRSILEERGPAPNVVILTGHNTLRAGIAGYENRLLSPDELKKMVFSLEQAIDEGSRGLSSGLLYPPGMFAPDGELILLARTVAVRDGIYTSHMRSEGSGLLDAIRETIDVGRQSSCRVEVSHLKASGKENWGLADEAIEIIEEARVEGVRVAADRYPYTFGCTDMDVIFPAWAEEGGREAILKRVRDKEGRARIRKALLEDRSDEDWGLITVGSTTHPDNERFRGMPVDEVAIVLEMDPVDAALHLIDTDDLRTGAFFSGMSDDNMMKILSQPWVMIGSDASLRTLSGPLNVDYPHPRAYGTFPRFLRMALDGKMMLLEEAIRKMTSLPAEQFGLNDRGLVNIGHAADLVVFDPCEFTDKASCANPHQLALGMSHVIINGVLTLKNGMLTGVRGGQVL